MSFDPENVPEYGMENLPPSDRTRGERATLPGVFLIVVGVVNLLAGGGMSGFGFMMGNLPTEQLREQMEKQNPNQMRDLEKSGYTIKDVQNWYLYGGGVGGAVAVLVSLIIMLGGIFMCVRRGYGLAILSAILTALPCISPSACPCLFGMGIGIWALVVLFDPTVKAAFR
jgi:hypothetical protein